MKCLIVLFAAAAVVLAKEGAKDKRDILIETHTPYYAPAVAYTHHAYAAPALAYPARTIAYAAPAVVHAAPAFPPYDDGKYFPGKYERPTFYSHVVV